MSASPDQLRPPNNKMRDVTVSYNSVDNCPGMSTCVLSVTSNEPGGNTDFIIIDDHHLKLRAKRLGNENGRIYTITTLCTDLAGNSSTASTIVSVPHDMSGSRGAAIAENSNNDHSVLSVKVLSNFLGLVPRSSASPFQLPLTSEHKAHKKRHCEARSNPPF